ncbi:MAG TPA: ATP-dependent Clp protease adaptor ClpS [Anaerolineae bacterium]|nr:ATP-dependent Clp protease adaptor ClpS [Anaerolineae bacterium]
MEQRRSELRPIFSLANPDVVTEPDVDVDADVGDGHLWKVIAHNDHQTTMDFVVGLLIEVFNKPLILAEAIMWQVHNEGQAVVATYPKGEAERLVRRAIFMARMAGFPFQLTIEPDK